MSEQNYEAVDGKAEIIPASAIESMTRGEIDCQIATAHKYPRSLEMYKKRAIAMATIDIETAESCLYARPVGGGKVAEGMSVRMAEIVGACYGNLRVGAIILEMNLTEVKARGVAHDLETNFASSSDIIESCLKADGKTPYDARMRVTVAKAAVAKARRDATFQVVPRALAKPIERAVRNLLADEKVQTFSQRRDGVVSWITEKLKIDPARVWALLSIKGPDDLQQEHLDLLSGLKTAIKDGDTSLDEAFPALVTKKPIFAEKPKTSDSTPSNSSTEGSAIPEKTKEGADAVSSGVSGTQKTVEKSDAVSGNQASPVAESANAMKLEILISDSGLKFADFVEVLHGSRMCARNAANIDDLTDKNIAAFIEDFADIYDAVKKGQPS
jgi:hypothetical protein